MNQVKHDHVVDVGTDADRSGHRPRLSVLPDLIRSIGQRVDDAVVVRELTRKLYQCDSLDGKRYTRPPASPTEDVSGSWISVRETLRRFDAANEQIELLDTAERALTAVQQFSPGGEFPAEHEVATASQLGQKRERALSIIYEYLQPAPDLNAIELVRRRSEDWRNYATALRNSMGPSPFVETLARLSSRSGVETTAILGALLVAFGWIYAYFFYSFAGIEPLTYWRIEDLLWFGAQLSPLTILIVLIVNGLIRLATRPLRKAPLKRYGFRHALILFGTNHSFWVGCALAMVGVAGFGAWYGHQAKNLAEDGSDEVAILSNGRELTGLTLAGLSSTTAVFLGPSGSLVVDRASVLCHSAQDNCQKYLDEAEHLSRLVPLVASEDDFLSFDRFAKTHLNCKQPIAQKFESVFFEVNEPLQDCRGDVEGCLTNINVNLAPQSVDPAKTTIWVIGFADASGAASSNLNLGERRAGAVAELLKKKGWEDVRPVSLGESRFVDRAWPHVNGSAADRRVDIIGCHKSA